MFERFTDRARRVVEQAQEEARMLNHDYIGTEHILMALTTAGGGVAAEALESLGISLDVVRQQVEEIIGLGQRAPSGHIVFTPRAKKVLELSMREATQLGRNHIGTEHILLGLVRLGDGVAAQILVKLGASLDLVRRQVLQRLPVDQEQDVTSEDSQLGGQAGSRRPDDARARIDALDHRLAAIERWVGMRPDLDAIDREIAQVRREKEAAIERQDFNASVRLRDQEKQLVVMRAAREKEGTEAAAGRLSLAAELGRVNAELERLRAVLRERGIEPGDDAA